MKYPATNYRQYLHLNSLLNAQSLRSAELGKAVHEEMLFIIVHQTYELWFKQIIFELDAVMSVFAKNEIPESEMGIAVARLERVVQIQKFITGQVDILESMTPMDFLEFRDYLYPASGFQSFQWRLIETKLGLQVHRRLPLNNQPFYNQLVEEEKNQILDATKQPSLFDLVQKWLERTPFLNMQDFEFWQSYQKAVENLFAQEKQIFKSLPMDEAQRAKNLEMMDKNQNTFQALFDEKAYDELQKQNHFRLSYKAIHAALFVQIYRDQPILQMPYRYLAALIDLDEAMGEWRHRHAQMVHRMIGKKVGTGGSSGHDYLKATVDQHRVFQDFFNLTSFLIPRSSVPKLPEKLIQKMTYQ